MMWVCSGDIFPAISCPWSGPCIYRAKANALRGPAKLSFEEAHTHMFLPRGQLLTQVGR